jgi:uncharacterized membrane protein (Fun14 family)
MICLFVSFPPRTCILTFVTTAVHLRSFSGLGFITLQTLSFYGYVKVDHNQLQHDFNDLLDLNKDGKVDTEDGKLIYNKVVKVLEFNLPAGGGFAAGFVGGLRSG